MTTDTAAALRAVEIEAKVILMAKHDVDGVYAADPHEDPGAVKFAFLTYLDAIERRLGIMDSTALSLCMENDIPIIVFDLFRSGQHRPGGERRAARLPCRVGTGAPRGRVSREDRPW